jgi:uncharacterized protein (DUF983 family)
LKTEKANMQHKKQSSPVHKLFYGMIARCPNCEQGLMFANAFRINTTCPVCSVRFERREGESIGGMIFTLGFAEILSIGGYFLFDALFDLSLATQLIIWSIFTIAFCILFYRSGRGLWVATVYLTGGVYRDDEAPPEEPKTDWAKINQPDSKDRE